MYDFLTGPALWASFLICILGAGWRVVWYFRGLDWKMDRVAYKTYPRAGLKGALRSIGRWLLPFGTVSWRKKPGFTIMAFSFHIGLLVTPVFLLAHTELMDRWIGFSPPALPPGVADGLAWLVLLCASGIVLRRILLPEVRILTTFYDYLVIGIAILPFLTGLMCRYQAGDYDFWLLCHIASGEIWLVAIPFTKLSHAVLFFCSRAQLGMDYGIKRGGMKGQGLAW